MKSITTAAGLKVRFLTFPGVLKANYPRKHHLQHLLMKRLLNQLKCLLMGQLPHQLQHLRIKQPQHLLKTSRHLKRHLLHSPPRRDGKYKYRVFTITILLIFFYLFIFCWAKLPGVWAYQARSQIRGKEASCLGEHLEEFRVCPTRTIYNRPSRGLTRQNFNFQHLGQHQVRATFFKRLSSEWPGTF